MKKTKKALWRGKLSYYRNLTPSGDFESIVRDSFSRNKENIRACLENKHSLLRFLEVRRF